MHNRSLNIMVKLFSNRIYFALGCMIKDPRNGSTNVNDCAQLRLMFHIIKED